MIKVTPLLDIHDSDLPVSAKDLLWAYACQWDDPSNGSLVDISLYIEDWDELLSDEENEDGELMGDEFQGKYLERNGHRSNNSDGMKVPIKEAFEQLKAYFELNKIHFVSGEDDNEGKLTELPMKLWW